MNIAAMTGYLTDNAVVKTTQSGKKHARFTIAVRNEMKKDTSDFFNVACWDFIAEYIEKGMQDYRFLKGCRVEVMGSFHNIKFKGNNGENMKGESIISPFFDHMRNFASQKKIQHI